MCTHITTVFTQRVEVTWLNLKGINKSHQVYVNFKVILAQLLKHEGETINWWLIFLANQQIRKWLKYVKLAPHLSPLTRRIKKSTLIKADFQFIWLGAARWNSMHVRAGEKLKCNWCL